LVTQTRNPGWTQEQIIQELHRQLGVLEIVWLDGGGLVGDDTDGHIDQLARFIDSENVVVAVCDDPGDENHEPLEENFRQLHLWGDATSPQVRVHRLPIPPARFIRDQRVPESYCNFLRLGKERLLIPTFAAETDDAALGLLREVSGADVVGVNCRDLVWGLGALHCASRDQPA
jgi:agmatine deiminase